MDIKKFIELIETVGILKNIPRMGWKMRGIPNCESVADHSYRVIVVSLFLGDLLKDELHLNMEKVLRIATLHELSESILTDLALGPALSVGRDVKHKAESAAFKEIVKDFPLKDKYYDDWMEFEEESSNEAKIAKLADKIDMMIQAYQYEKVGARNLDDFWNHIENFETYEIEYIKKFYDKLDELHKNLVDKK